MSIFSRVRAGKRLPLPTQQKRTHGARRRHPALASACLAEALESRRLLSSTLVSANSTNTAAGNGSSDQLYGPFISNNGRFVAFESQATNLTSSGASFQEVYLRDRLTGSTTLISRGADNAPAAGNSWVADMTPDGRYVLFFTAANLASSNVETNRASVDQNNDIDLYVRDTATNTTYLVSGDSHIQLVDANTGAQFPPTFEAIGVVNDGTKPTLPAYISDDGRFVSFVTPADDASKRDHIADAFSIGGTTSVTDFIDNNGAPDIYIRDRQQSSTILVTEGITNNKTPNTTEVGTIDSYAMSADGAAVVISTSDQLNSVDTNGDADVYYRNVTTGATTGISTNNVPVAPDTLRYLGGTSNVAISADGSTIAYVDFGDLFVWTPGENRGRDVTFGDGGNSGGGGGGGGGGLVTGGVFGTPAISPNGRYIAFYSTDSNLTTEGTDGNANVFRYDRGADLTTDRDPFFNGDDLLELVSIGATGGTNVLPGNANAGRLSMSSDGRFVAFQSDATGLVPSVTNYGAPGQTNVFVRDMNGTSISLVNSSAADGTVAANANAYQPLISPDGKVVAFVSTASDLAISPADTNAVPDVYTSDVPSTPSSPLAAILDAPNVSVGGATSYTFRVTYSGPRPISLASIDSDDILVRTPSGTFIAATLVSVNGTANANALTATYQIVPPGDFWDTSDNGTYTVHLQNRQVADVSGNALLAQDLGTFTVNIAVTSNVGPTFSTTVSESAGTFTLHIQRNPTDAGNVTASVDYQVLSGTATLGQDFTIVTNGGDASGTLTNIPPGGSADLVFQIVNDSLVEGPESFSVVLSNATVGATFTFQQATITILDDDAAAGGGGSGGGGGPITVPGAGPVPVTVGNSTISVVNGVTTITAPETAGTITIPLTRAGTGTTAATATFNYTIYSNVPEDTAVAGVNFVPVPGGTGTLTFSAGSDTPDTPLTVTLLHDFQVTGDRSFTVVLSNATNGVILTGTSVRVVELDVDSAVQFASDSLSTVDDAGVIDIPLTRIGNVTPASKVDLNFSGTAIAGQDYTLVGDASFDPVTGLVTFAPGETSKTVHVQLLSRPFNPGSSRTLNLSLSSPFAVGNGNGIAYATVLGTPSTETVTIANVDATGPQVAAVDFHSNKAGKISAVTVTFTEDVTAAGAQKLANYSLFTVNSNGKLGHLNRLASASYDASTRTVTLTPRAPLPANHVYQLVVSGHGSIKDASGNTLNSNRKGVIAGSTNALIAAGKTLTYREADNDLVTFKLKGPGSLKLTSLNNAITLDVLNPDPSTSTLLGTVKKGKGGNGKATLALLNLNGATFDANPTKFEGNIVA